MPLYDYECANCHAVLKDVFQHIQDEPIVHCVACGQNTLKRCICAPLMVLIRGAKTVGSLADRNSSDMSTDERQHALSLQRTQKTEPVRTLPNGMQRIEQTPGYKPWFAHNQTVSNKKINKMTKKQKQKYIITGKTTT